MQFLEKTLDNGLQVIAEVNEHARSMATAFFVQTGSRDELPELSGVSHFLEHMVFKGTPNRSAADVNRELDEIGSQSNAYTSEEQTVYYAAVLPEYQTKAVELLCDILRPSLRTDDFETEKKVIIEEIHKYDDQPPYGAHEKCMASYFGQHALGQSVLGSVQTVTDLSPEQMRDYFEKRYSPQNIKLCAAGKVDFDQLVADAEQFCGEWEKIETSRDLAMPAACFSTQAIHRESSSQEYVVQISGGPSAADSKRYAHRLLCSIFGDESGSRFFWAFVDTGAAEYAAVFPYEFQGTGITMTYLSCTPEQTAGNLTTLAELQTQLLESGVTDDELQLARSKICSQIVRRAERPANRMFSVGNNWLQRGRYVTIQEAVENYRSITVDDINTVIREYPFDKHAMVIAGPLTEIPS